MQNRILKNLFTKDWFTPTGNLHHQLQMLQVQDIFRSRVAQFVHKCLNGRIPGVFQNYYKTVNQLHNHRTRQSQKLHVAKTRTKIGEKSVKIIGAKMYNDLPEHITDCKTDKSFKNKRKLHILDGYM